MAVNTVNRNNLKQAPIPVVPRTMKVVNADGTVTRSGQLLLEQLQAPSVTEGTHANRPNAADVADGALYVESDRGVVYYNDNGVWKYLAGTMWGTLSPDQRPTDLGTNDAGFIFHGTDYPREFVWNGTAWIEATPVRWGTHAERLALVLAKVIDGELYVESDRWNVTYQNQGGAWRYIDGTMYGTVSPTDQRPTDLGSQDAGFDFRTNTAPAHQFIWSGTAWVEVGADYRVNGALIGTRPALNLIAGSNVTISGSDNAGSDRVDVTVASSGGGTGGGVTSVFGRTGAVVAAGGDYSASQVTNAVDQTGSYPNPVWIPSYAWSKITGAPAFLVSPLTTKGDIHTYSTADTRLPVGSNNQVLVADSAQTTGIKWAASPVFVASGASHASGAVPDPGATAGTGRFLREDATWQVPYWVAGSAGAIYYNGGSVGIGTTGPSYPLDAASTATNAPVIRLSTSASGGALGLYNTNANAASRNWAVVANFAAYGDFAICSSTTQGGNPLAGAGNVLFYINPSGQTGIATTNPSYLLHVSLDSAAKPATNTWTVPSDSRLKRNIKELAGGLDIIRCLRPVEAEYNGLCGLPEGKRVLSFLAEEIRQVLPGTVTSHRGKLRAEDTEETDILDFNLHEVLMHLILAVQQLSKKIG